MVRARYQDRRGEQARCHSEFKQSLIEMKNYEVGSMAIGPGLHSACHVLREEKNQLNIWQCTWASPPSLRTFSDYFSLLNKDAHPPHLPLRLRPSTESNFQAQITDPCANPLPPLFEHETCSDSP